MTRIRMTGWIAAAALLAAVPASAETFHSRDGVVFEGTLRKVVAQAAVCNVLEQNHTPDEYERLKSNHGQPLYLWQVDFAVRNESGRELEYLRASRRVHSEHPPCTNWSGEGPGGGPVLPEPSLLISTGWGDYYQVLQRPSGMRPGQQERSARYLVVFHEHQPRFGEWDIDYTFAKEAGARKEPAAGASRTPVSGGATSTAPAGSESQENLFWQSIMNSTAAADFEAYLRQFPNGIFRVLAQNRLAALRGSASRVESRAPQPPRQAEQGRPSGISAGQTCAGQEGGTACWMELSSHPGCYVRAFRFYPDRPLAWSAECSGGLASGTGTLTWIREGSDIEESGLLRNGKPEGRWVQRYSSGRVQEGAFVDGKREGKWTLQWGDEGSGEEWYVNGKRHGRYVSRYSDGSGGEGMYVDGERHGRWIDYSANKEPAGGVYEHGAKQGEWVEHYGYQTRRGPYVDGEEHGEWVERWGSDVVHRGPYVDGEKHGRWVERLEEQVRQLAGQYAREQTQLAGQVETLTGNMQQLGAHVTILTDAYEDLNNTYNALVKDLNELIR